MKKKLTQHYQRRRRNNNRNRAKGYDKAEIEKLVKEKLQ